jgi:hypothetical protein
MLPLGIALLTAGVVVNAVVYVWTALEERR